MKALKKLKRKAQKNCRFSEIYKKISFTVAKTKFHNQSVITATKLTYNTQFQLKYNPLIY